MEEVEDLAFGAGVFVYCNQHMRPHLTGWCSVGIRNKIKLDAINLDEAYEECKKKNYELYRG